MISLAKKLFSITIIQYAIIGGTVAFADLVFFYVLTSNFPQHYLLINAAGFILGTFANYVLSIKFVFNSGARFNKPQEISLVFIVSSTGLVLNQMFLFTLHEYVELELLPAKIITVGLVFFWNYLARKYYVFQERATE